MRNIILGGERKFMTTVWNLECAELACALCNLARFGIEGW